MSLLIALLLIFLALLAGVSIGVVVVALVVSGKIADEEIRRMQELDK